jgi:hypothetical protein
MSSAKRLKLSRTSDDDDTTSQHGHDDVHMKSQTDSDHEEEASFSEGSDEQSASGSEPDTEEEITNAKLKKSSKTLKRKRRATEPSQFGATLQSLLDTQAPSALPLSLRPNVARKKNDEKLEKRAHKVLQIEKKEKEDKGRIKDVIGGWGGESERMLRKVAQRGGKQQLQTPDAFRWPTNCLMHISRKTIQCDPTNTKQRRCSCRGNQSIPWLRKTNITSTVNRSQRQAREKQRQAKRQYPGKRERGYVISLH